MSLQAPIISGNSSSSGNNNDSLSGYINRRRTSSQATAAAARVAEQPAKRAKMASTAGDSDTHGLEDDQKEEIPEDSRVNLTEVEHKVFSTLLATCEQFKLPTRARVAGGWVRDKLLGMDSDDIDIALDGMMGEVFARKVNEYLESQGMPTHDVGVIRVNPDQSKHLETAALRLFGVSLDCTNTRTESYSDDSRVPEIQMGTPREDALRRDFTMNALFYNLHTGKVEDWTGTGVEDLRAGVVRTPLPPLQTFKDDPLRVLRAARFAGRFLFQPEPELCQAASNKEVKDFLGTKISRERIGIEVWKMFQGHPKPEHVDQPALIIEHESQCVGLSMQLLRDWGLYDIVFHVPEDFIAEQDAVEVHPDLGGRESSALALDYLTDLDRRLQAIESEVAGEQPEEESRRVVRLAAFLLPLFGTIAPGAKKRGILTSLKHIVLNSLKLPRKLADRLDLLVRAAHDINRIARVCAMPADVDHQHLHQQRQASQRRLAIGRLLRQIKTDWDLAALLALVLAPGESRHRVLELVLWVRQESMLYGCWDVPPLFDGKMVKRAFPALQNALVGKAMELQALQYCLFPEQDSEQRKAQLLGLLEQLCSQPQSDVESLLIA